MAEEYLSENDDNINDNEDIVIVTDDAEDADTGHDEDERLAHDDHGEEDGDDERAAIRERRRREKQERKERKETAIKRDKLELDFLRKRNDDLERRLTAQEERAHKSDLDNIDAHYNKAVQEAQMAERVIAKAVEAGNGDDVAQAMRLRDQAIAKAQQLASIKQQTERQPVQQAPAVDNITLQHAKEFMEDHSWYDPQGRDEDSAIVLAIDQTLAREGYDPRSEDYWDELRDRVARKLPKKFGKEDREEKPRAPRGGPAVGSSREHAPASTRKEIYISPERKQALIDAGVWDDPQLRMRYVKKYAEYDKLHKN